MPTKRTSAPEERSKRTVKPRIRVPHAESRPVRAPRRRAVAKKKAPATLKKEDPIVSVAPSTPVIVQPNEKRSLILAHAAMRRPRDPVQMVSMWAGVVATFVVVIGAWWWASKPVYLEAFSRPVDSGVEFVQQDAASFGQNVHQLTNAKSQELSHDVVDVANRLNALNAQVENSQQTLDRLAAMVSSTAPQQGIFQPTSSSTSLTTTTHLSD